MKNKLLFMLAFLIFASPLISQKLKDKKITVKYISLPSKKLPEDFKTYSVYAYGSAISVAGSSREGTARSVKMDGFRRMEGVGSDYGHLRVIVNTGYVYAGRGDFKSKTTTKKDKDGKETKTTNYWYNVPVNASGSYKILDPKGNVLSSNTYKKNETQSTTKYSTSAQARKSYPAQVNSIRTSHAKSIVSAVVSGANADLARNYDFNHAIDYPQLYLIKKHDSADGFEKHFEKAKAYFGKADYGSDPEEAKSQMAASLEFWQREGTEDLVGDKKLQRVYEAANFNCAVINYYLENFDEAEKFANKVIKASDGKHRRSENLLKSIAKTKERMALHNINTMYYVRDVSNAMGPKEVSAFEEEKEELAEENDSMEGTLIVNGQEVKGSVLLDKDAEEITFGEDGNLKFMVEGDGEMKNYDLTKKEITVIQFGDRKFTKQPFVPKAKGKSDEGFHILEELYVSDKIKLLKYYPSTGKLGDNPTEFAFMKKSDEKAISLSDTQFLLWNKGLANYFSDCSDLKGMCEGGGIKSEKDDLIKAARIYSELCN